MNDKQLLELRRETISKLEVLANSLIQIESRISEKVLLQTVADEMRRPLLDSELAPEPLIERLKDFITKDIVIHGKMSAIAKYWREDKTSRFLKHQLLDIGIDAVAMFDVLAKITMLNFTEDVLPKKEICLFLAGEALIHYIGLFIGEENESQSTD